MGNLGIPASENDKPRKHVQARDLADPLRAVETQKFLGEAGEILSFTLDPEVTYKNLMRLCVPRLSDWAALIMTRQDGTIEDMNTASVTPQGETAWREIFSRYRCDPARPDALAQALLSREPILYDRVDDALIDIIYTVPEARALSRKSKLRSFICVPIVARGNLLGALMFGMTVSARHFGAGDLAVALDLARRAGLAIDNARLYQQAQSAIHAREDILAIVAHDLRNPLSAIRLNTELLKLFSKPERSEAAAEKFAKAIENVEIAVARANRQIDDLLTFAKMEAGPIVIEREPHPIGEILLESVELLRPLAEKKGVALRLNPVAEGLEIPCDRDRLIQVLSNLIGNAIKFTPKDGEVRVACELGSDRQLVVSVADTGIGIPEAELSRLFDRFWQGRRGDRRDGAGLGLFIAKGIVEAHGGRIWAESGAGGGSTFFFALPIREAGAAQRIRSGPDM